MWLPKLTLLRLPGMFNMGVALLRTAQGKVPFVFVVWYLVSSPRTAANSACVPHWVLASFILLTHRSDSLTSVHTIRPYHLSSLLHMCICVVCVHVFTCMCMWRPEVGVDHCEDVMTIFGLSAWLHPVLTKTLMTVQTCVEFFLD